MQNDLISRSALIEELKKCTCTDKHDERIIKDFVVHIVEKQPIAYDVEKVVAELEENKQPIVGVVFDENIPSDDKAFSRFKFNVGIETAIEIVRNGGKE